MDISAVNLSTAALTGQENCLGHLSNVTVDSLNQINDLSALSPVEMLNQDNFGDLSNVFGVEPENNFLRRELPSITSDLHSLTNGISAQSTMLTHDTSSPETVCSSCETHTTKYSSSILETSLLPALEYDDISNYCNQLNSFDSYTFNLPGLESETSHNISEFIEQNVTLTEGNSSVENECASPLCNTANSEVSSSTDEITVTKGARSSREHSQVKSPHEKYMEMRRKNNIASRRSRQIRKEKNQEMVVKIAELEKENIALKSTVEKLERQKDALQNYLLKIIKKSR